MECYKKAAAQKPFFKIGKSKELIKNLGVLEAEHAIGNAFRDGRGVDVDDEKAFLHYLRAAELGLPESQNNVGVALYNGMGVPQMWEQAREWFGKAAEQGIAEAQMNYARMLETDEGTTY